MLIYKMKFLARMIHLKTNGRKLELMKLVEQWVDDQGLIEKVMDANSAHLIHPPDTKKHRQL